MKLKKEILDMINNPQSCNRIALTLNRAANSVSVQIRLNKENGRLTKMDALTAIAAETGYPVDQLYEKSETIPATN